VFLQNLLHVSVPCLFLGLGVCGEKLWTLLVDDVHQLSFSWQKDDGEATSASNFKMKKLTIDGQSPAILSPRIGFLGFTAPVLFQP
jgi:hypothetical protein